MPRIAGDCQGLARITGDFWAIAGIAEIAGIAGIAGIVGLPGSSSIPSNIVQG